MVIGLGVVGNLFFLRNSFGSGGGNLMLLLRVNNGDGGGETVLEDMFDLVVLLIDLMRGGGGGVNNILGGCFPLGAGGVNISRVIEISVGLLSFVSSIRVYSLFIIIFNKTNYIFKSNLD